MNSNQKMKEFLEPTKYCDFNHPDIIAKAKKLTAKDKTPKDMALSIFHFVRDKIHYEMPFGGEKATDTLAIKSGACGAKANLQIALLRSVNIPARFHYVTLRKECLKEIVSNFYYKNTPEIIHHMWCECYLSGKWIVCDSMLDKKLADVAYQKGIYSREDIPTIEWDGEHNVNTMTKWIVEDKGTLSSLDKMYDSEESPGFFMKTLIRFVTKRSNAYTKKLRNYQPK